MEALGLVEPPQPAATGEWIVVDATLGEGGHAGEILRRLRIVDAAGKLIGIERDPRMLAALGLVDPRLVVVEGNFRDLGRIVASFGHDRVKAVLADLGVSTRHYRTPEWGFSFVDGPLDMRLGVEGPTAADVVNRWLEPDLARLFLDAGERRGRRIARALVDARKKTPIRRTSELADLLRKAIGGGRSGSHPATKVFRALREAVTGEMKDLAALIPAAAAVLVPGGRLAILAYTWEEERLVRTETDALVKGCICPPDFPECRCGRKPLLRWVTRRGVRPAAAEIRSNPSARSAKLFVIERI